MSGDVAQGQFGECVAPVESAGAGCPCRDEVVGVFSAVAGSATDERGRLGRCGYESEGLAVGGKAGVDQTVTELLAGLGSVGLDCVDDGGDGGLEREMVDPERAALCGVERREARPGEFAEPDDVGWVDEVPGGAQHVGPQQITVVEGCVNVGSADTGRATSCQRPARLVVVLGLYRQEPTHRVRGVGERCACEALRVESPAGDVAVIHER